MPAGDAASCLALWQLVLRIKSINPHGGVWPRSSGSGSAAAPGTVGSPALVCREMGREGSCLGLIQRSGHCSRRPHLQRFWVPLFAGARQALGSSARQAAAFLEPRVHGGTWGLDQPLAQHQASLVRPCLPRSVGCLEKQQGSRIGPLINTKSPFILFYFIF